MINNTNMLYFAKLVNIIVTLLFFLYIYPYWMTI